MGTYGVHNVKFYNPEPKAINCIACEPKHAKLAVARADHSIEIWDVGETPHVDRVLIGDPLSNSIECLTWFNDRLFSGGLQGFVNEYDLRRLKIKTSTAVTSGTCWCLAVHKKKRLLAAGTEEGHINLFQISDEGLLYEKLLDRQQGRILCAAWHSSGDFLVTGSVNAVRIWNIHKGHALHKMSLDKLKHRNTNVWCLTVCQDFTIITGDSSGFVKFWDGHHGIQTSEVKTHKKDILSLCMSEDENYLYCAGVDPTVVCFQRARKPSMSNVKFRNSNSLENQKDGVWIRSVNRVIHESSVKALALHGTKLYSGGMDSYLALSYYPPKTLIKYPCTSAQTTPITISKESNLILLQYSNYLEIWSLGSPQINIKDGDSKNIIEKSNPEIGLSLKLYPKLLIKINSLNNLYIRCSNISNDGKYIVYSTEENMRLHSFLEDDDSDKPQLARIKNLPVEFSHPCLHLKFSPDSSLLLCVTKGGPLYILELECMELKWSIDPYKNNLMTDIICLVQISNCNQYLVCGDRHTHVVVWKQGQHLTSLPRYKKPPTSLGIHPTHTNLIVVYSDHKIVEFDLNKVSFTSFSRKLDTNHPKEWLLRNVPVLDITFDPRDSNVIYLIDDSAICVINKNKSLANSDAKIPRLGPKLGSSDNSNSTHVMESKVAFHFVRRNKHLIYFGNLNINEMVSVQVNPLSFMEKLAPTWIKKQFGVC